MTKRSMCALAVATAMGLAACGGGSKTLSESDFVDQVNGFCGDASHDLNRIDSPASIDDIEQFAKDTADVFQTLQDNLADIAPPKDLANDFADAQSTIDDVLSKLSDLERAGKDGNEDDVNSIADDLSGLSDDLTGLAGDLGVDDCVFDENADAPATTETIPETTVPPTTVPITLPPTVPPATAAPATAPPATAPPATAPPATLPAVTSPPQTAPADTGALFSVVDLTQIFYDPYGFTMVDTGMDAAVPFIDAVASIPILNVGIDEMGVAALIDSVGDASATLVVGAALQGFGMPEEWKTIICPPSTSTIRTTSAGYTGVYCPGQPGSGLIEVFTITQGDLGITVASVDPYYSVLDITDAFLLANF